MKTTRMTKIVTGALGALLLPFGFAAFKTFQGNPRWPLRGSFHYVADLNPISFPASSVWDAHAQYAISDWRDMGATAFSGGFTRTQSDFNNHANGVNSWVWLNRPAESWLGICFTRWNGSDIVDADIWFNARTDYPWALGLTDPCKDHGYSPYDFRGVARHETGHAIGLDHEDVWCCQMNAIYERGVSIPHTGASGELPHADDKFGCRFLYYQWNAPITYNLMATCWRPGNGQVSRFSTSGTYQAGVNSVTVPVYIQNQTNSSFAATQRLGVYLSSNDVISTGDIRIADIQFSGSWNVYGEAYYQFNVPIPASIAAGTYHVGAIIDWNNALGERYEGDNAARVGVINVLAYRKYVAGSLTPFGTGCAGRTGVLSHTASGSADYGTPVSYRLANGPLSGGAAFYLGFSNTSWGPLRLPFDVGIFGAPGCTLYVDPLLQLPVPTTSAGGATATLTLANDKRFLGMSLFTQFVGVEPGLNRLGLTYSNGVQTRIGGYE